MSTSRKIQLNEEDRRLYGKLHAASHDLAWAKSYGEYILKRAWQAKPWSRGSTYLQQSAFVTAMITSYGRAFSQSRGWPKFPQMFFDYYSSEQISLHYNIINLRNKIYAHSDAENYEVQPYISDYHSDIERVPVFEFDAQQTRMLIEMCEIIKLKICKKLYEIKIKYVF